MAKFYNFSNLNYKAIIIIGIILASSISLIGGYIGGYNISNLNCIPTNEDQDQELYDLGYDYGYGNGTTDTRNELTESLVNLKIYIPNNFEVIIVNDSLGVYDNTTFDVRELSVGSIHYNLNLINAIYQYIAEDDTNTIDLGNWTEISEKLGFNMSNFSEDYSAFGGFDENHFCDNFLPTGFVDHTESIIGSRNLVQFYNQAFINLFKLYIYANNTLIDANGEGYEGSFTGSSAFGCIFEDFGVLVLGGMVFTNETIDALFMSRTYNKDTLTINSITLDVDNLTYVVSVTYIHQSSYDLYDVYVMDMISYTTP